MNKRILSLVLGIVLILSNLTFINAAQTCKPNVDDYTVKNNVDMEVSRIEQGETARISVDIIDDVVKTNEVTSPDDISITSVDGSFGSPDTDSIEITSKGTDKLEFTVNFKEATYSGTGTTISFKVKYNKLNLTSDKIILQISECSERDNPNDDGGSGNEGTSNKQPYVEISRSNIPTPIKANEEFTLQLIIKNRGSAKMKRPVMTISLPDSINSLDGMGNIQVPDIDAGTSRNITLRLKADDYIQSASESIDISLSYNYDSGSGDLTSGSYTDRIFIPMVATEKSSAPLIQISRGSFSAPINADQEFTLPVIIKNIGETEVSAPVLTLTFPDEIIPLDDSSTTALPVLKPGTEINKNIKLKTKKYITSSTQEITAELKYNYKSENDNVQGTESTKLIIPSVPNNDKGAEPLLHIVTESTEKPLKSSQKFSVKVTINNIGATDIKAGVLSWDPGEGIILTDKTASVNIGTLKAGSSKEITLKGKTGSKLTATTQTINGELTYKYDTKENTAQGQETIKVVLPTQPEEDEEALKSATPNIIVNQYNYGGVPIANGNMFNFDVSFKNTSKQTPIENIVMSIETDTGLSIHSASNTYYYEKLSPLGVQSQSIGMQVLPTAETGSVKLTINFSYEYVENNERKQVSSSQNVSIPVYKPDKLEITLEPLPVATAGQEQTVTLNYVNKGKGELSNVKAEITGDVTALTSVQNLGNFESGKSGTINFIVVPEVPGEANFTITVSYEDANMEQKTLEFPCTMTVEEYVEDTFFPDDSMEMEEEPSSHMGVIIGSVIGAVVVIIIIVVVLKKRKKRKLADSVSVNWEAADEDKGLD